MDKNHPAIIVPLIVSGFHATATLALAFALCAHTPAVLALQSQPTDVVSYGFDEGSGTVAHDGTSPPRPSTFTTQAMHEVLASQPVR